MLDLISKTELQPKTWVLTAVGLFIAYYVCKWIYNIYFHPLSKIPGPKIAAMTSLYEFYYEVVKDGAYLWEIRKMHAKYGPIVRVSPREIHIDDPHYYSTVYAGGTRKIEKDSTSIAGLGVPKSVVATIDHNLHRKRRGYLKPYFSKRAAIDLEPIINERIDRLFSRLHESRKAGEAINLDFAFASMTADIITLQFYGQHFDYLGDRNFRLPIRDAFLGASYYFNLARFIPRTSNFLMKTLPVWFIRWITPELVNFQTFQDEIREVVKVGLESKLMTEAEKNSVIVQTLGELSIPPEERTLDRLLDEGTTVLIAGTGTTARVLACAMFFLLNDKPLLLRLREEVTPLLSNPDNEFLFSRLELLPFLTGVIKESLRLSLINVSRLIRVSPEEPWHYKDHTVPPGWPVSQSIYFVHTNTTIFPDPYAFIPDRWVKAAEQGIDLNKFNTSFTKGSRQCLGMAMAYAELYLTLAKMVYHWDLELDDTTLDDVAVYRIRRVGHPKEEHDGKGNVKVKVTKKIA